LGGDHGLDKSLQQSIINLAYPFNPALASASKDPILSEVTQNFEVTFIINNQITKKRTKDQLKKKIFSSSPIQVKTSTSNGSKFDLS
jgi:hypothetical protein